ncbi:MAG: alpha/beta hydrolase family protein [Woeseiaceae bacterium]
MFKTLSAMLLLVLGSIATADAKPEQVSFETADGVRIYGDVYAGSEGASAATILLFHQAGSDARGEYTSIALRLMENGYNVLAIDQRSGGDRFGGVNRTMAGLERRDFGYCEVYPDLEAALKFMRDEGFDGPLAVWGSSYSAALVFQLGARNADDVDAVLGFSPASGTPLKDCSLSPYLEKLDVPGIALRPQNEFEIEAVQAQMKEFENHGVQTYVANPGVHGSSMLNAERVGESTEATWTVVLDFLAESLATE